MQLEHVGTYAFTPFKVYIKIKNKTQISKKITKFFRIKELNCEKFFLENSKDPSCMKMHLAFWIPTFIYTIEVLSTFYFFCLQDMHFLKSLKIVSLNESLFRMFKILVSCFRFVEKQWDWDYTLYVTNSILPVVLCVFTYIFYI